MRILLAAGLCLTTTVSATAQAPVAIDTVALRAHAYFLAGDWLEGRSAGTRGARAAALYIEEQLRRLGLEPAFDGDYRQPVPLVRFQVDPVATTLQVSDAEGTRHFDYDGDFVAFGGGAPAFRGFGGSVVFFGTAALARQSLRGNRSLDGRVIAVVGPLGGAAGQLIPDWTRRGAEGVILMLPDSQAFRQLADARSARHYYVDAALGDPIWQPRLPMVLTGPEVAGALLAGVPVNALAARGQNAFEPVDLGRSIKVSIQGTSRPLPAANVGAILRGTTRPDEFVAVGAHFDHLGVVPGAGPDSIYNGFSDNAAGVAMTLSLAQALRDEPPERSVLFLFFTGEERGLLGSTYYVTAPAIPLRRTVGMVNLDAGAPPAPSIEWRIGGGTVSTFGALADSVVSGHGWTVQLADPSPNADYWPFLMQGVPAIFPIPEKTWEDVTTAERQQLIDRFERYHRPDDHWVADFPFNGLQRYAELALELVRAAAAGRQPRMTVQDGP